MERTGARAPTPCGVLLFCLGPFHTSQARRHNSECDMSSHNRLHRSNCYSRPLRAVRHRPTGNMAQRSQPERAHQTTDRPATQSLHHHQPVKSRLHSRNSFVSTPQHLLCKPTEARVAAWQEEWEATQSNLKKYDIHPREELASGHTLPWHT